MNNAFMGNPILSRMGNMMQTINQCKQYMSGFQGGPQAAQQQVQQLLNSGRMSQDNFNQLAQAARIMQSFM